MPQGSDVNHMFSKIARRYDFVNLLLSAGVDRYWRWRLARLVKACKPKTILDLATGSGDVAFCLSKTVIPITSIVGMDFCKEMIQQAQEKQVLLQKNNNSLSPYDSIVFKLGDCMQLPVLDESFDVVTVAFGVRNFEDRQKGFREIYRVLRKPHGACFILEFSQPYFFLKPFYYLYLKYILPSIARWIVGAENKSAYNYLAGSIHQFPESRILGNELKQAGFKKISYTRLTGGIVAIHEARIEE